MSKIAQYIRPLALGVILKGGKILAVREFDRKKNETFYRLIGGGIEFGETGKDALKREFTEELGVEINVKKRLGVLENLFTFEDQQGHEICLLYSMEFSDKNVSEKEKLPMIEPQHAGKVAEYVDVNTPHIYPNGWQEYIKQA